MKRIFKRIWLRLYRLSARLGLESLFFRASYTLATRLLGSRRVQQVLFPNQVALVQSFLQRTELQATHPVTPTVRQLLLETTVALWCYVANPANAWSAAEIERDFVVENWHVFEQAHSAGRGVLLLLSHYGLSRAIFPFMRQQGHDGPMVYLKAKKRRLSVGQELTDLERMLRSAQDLVEAQQTLASGGVAYILPDGTYGATSVTLPIYDRMRHFKTGFAELVVSSGACAMPVTAVPRADGKLCITFYPPFEVGSPAMSQSARVEMLVRQYAAHLAQIWALSPGSTRHMHRHLHGTKVYVAESPAGTGMGTL